MDQLNLVAIAVIIGIVKGIVSVLQTYTSVDVNTVFGVLLALAVGIILGVFHVFGLSVETGIVSALVGTGTYQLAKKVGGN